jgi:TonB-linked SusC/RagA family outer membrane protein
MMLKFYKTKQKHQSFGGVILLLILLFFAGSLNAQERTVTGNITDVSGVPLPGVNIAIKGTSTGTVTDLNGNFALKIPDNKSVLSITYVGYNDQEITAGEQTNIKVVLVENVKEIDQVVVIGYGSMKKSDLTGSVASVSSKDLRATPVTRIDEALEGRAAGVNVVAATGMPGGSRNIQIRGVSSINGFKPLIVVDGIPSNDNEIMNKINPGDIESIEILKDAASAAIYGSTGGNGVVLISTKKGKVGNITTNINMYTGVQDVPKQIPLMDTRQWNLFYAAKNGIPFISSEDSLNMNTNWQSEIYRQAPQKNCDISITGGTEKSQFALGANYLDQQGIIKNTAYNKYGISLNSQHQITKRIKIDQVFRFSNDKTTGPAEWQYQNMYNNFTTKPAISFPPFLKPYDANGKWTVSPIGGGNPFTGIDARSNQYIKNLNVQGNFGLNLEIIKNLTYTGRVSGESNNKEYWNFLPKYYSWANDNNLTSKLEQDWNRAYSWTVQNYLTYNFTLLDDHNITLMAGTEASDWWDYSIRGSRLNYVNTSPDLLYFDNSPDVATPSQIVGGSGKEATSTAYFGRFNYSFRSLFLFQFNARRDGNSNFGPNNKWGNFYSGSTGLKFSELQVVKDLNIFSFGKVRFSYGETGQFPVTTYWPYASTILSTSIMNYAFNDKDISIGMGPVQVPNPDLQWETVKSYNIGLDLGFFKDQLMLNIEYFNKINDGMIMPKQVSAVAGTHLIAGGDPAELGSTGIKSANPLVNYGSVSNQGIEISMDIKKQFGDLKLNANLNFTYQKNEITDLAIDSTVQGSVHDLSGLTISKIGYPIGTFRGYKFIGLFKDGDTKIFNRKTQKMVFADQPYYVDAATGDTSYDKPNAKPGDAKFLDLNNDGRINTKDRDYLGSYIPPIVYGFTFGAEFKGIDFSAFFQGVYGNEIFNGLKRDLVTWETSLNHGAFFADRYHLPTIYVVNNTTITDPGNTTSNVPDVGSQNWGQPSSLYVEDGSYLRLRSLTIGYTIPKVLTDKIMISRLRFYFTAKNLLTITDYSGYDPEISSYDPKLAGIDIVGYPQSKMYTFGLNLDF